MELHNLKQAVDKAKDRLFEADLRTPLRPSLRKEYPPAFLPVEVERRRTVQPLPESEADKRSPVDELVERWAAGLTSARPQEKVAPAKPPASPAPVHLAKPPEAEVTAGKPVAPKARIAELEIEYSQTRRLNTQPEVLEANRIINPRSKPEVLAAYKMLRTQVLQKMRARQWTSLGIITTRSGQGGSVTASNLAISLAQEVTHSVLLADFNFRKPGLHQKFGINPQCGIGDYLFSSMPLGEVLVCPQVDRLSLLPCLAPIDDSSMSLSAPKLVSLVDELKHRYEQRVVIYDLPPALEGDDVLAFAPYIDAVLLVVEESATSQDDILEVVELLKDVPLLGTVLNKSRNT
ncbi:MAG: CpsD/CapB family tyrosine-protein kinase [Hahellaceae bacterium]|jgi:protein-tyrosine kinase|nr:CpsD/CapB family tyrosine-protein kinase [Hahellaceae bacterium]